ncbi:MAG: hypothetical protein L0I87_05595, partial [Corynebacterium casei]|nr:hypothetical protein [Corynebacterium casei]
DSTIANQLRTLGAGISPRGIRLATKTSTPRTPDSASAPGAPGSTKWEPDFEPEAEAETGSEVEERSPRRGRSLNEALEELSFDDPPSDDRIHGESNQEPSNSQRRSGPMRPRRGPLPPRGRGRR